MKLILGQLLTDFEFEPYSERPKFVNLGEITIPSEKMKAKVRRRKVVSSIDAAEL
jgi:hypothetical protein